MAGDERAGGVEGVERRQVPHHASGADLVPHVGSQVQAGQDQGREAGTGTRGWGELGGQHAERVPGEGAQAGGEGGDERPAGVRLPAGGHGQGQPGTEPDG